MLNEVGQPVLASRLRNDERKYRLTFVVFGIFLAILILNLFWVNTIVLQSKYRAATTVAITPPIATPIPTEMITPTPSTISSPITAPTTTIAAKDHFIPLGSGAGQSADWEDIVGMVASVDLGQYQVIKSVLFEASVTVPTANQYVTLRLYNKTDGHPVWNSEVTMNTASSYLISAPVIYDSGVKLYQVQLKTQLQFPVSISQARIHVILK